MNSFRNSLNNLVRTDRPESVSRALALFFGINTPGWIWYALLYDKTASLLTCLAQVLAFIALILGVKQVTEKGAANVPASQDVGVQQ